jgi:hypothetical protein
VIRAQSVEVEAGERSEEVIINISEDVQYNKGCSEKMVQMLMDSQDPNLASKDHEICLRPGRSRRRAVAS